MSFGYAIYRAQKQHNVDPTTAQKKLEDTYLLIEEKYSNYIDLQDYFDFTPLNGFIPKEEIPEEIQKFVIDFMEIDTDKQYSLPEWNDTKFRIAVELNAQFVDEYKSQLTSSQKLSHIKRALFLL